MKQPPDDEWWNKVVRQPGGETKKHKEDYLSVAFSSNFLQHFNFFQIVLNVSYYLYTHVV